MRNRTDNKTTSGVRPAQGDLADRRLFLAHVAALGVLFAITVPVGHAQELRPAGGLRT